MKNLCKCFSTFALAGFVAFPALADEAPDYKDTLTGDWNGTRTKWAEKGIDTEITYKGDLFGNVSGGIKNGWRGLDNLDVIFSFDGGKLLGSKGTSAQIHFLNNNGGHPDTDLTGSAQGIDNIEVPQATAKLYQAWVQQNFLDDAVSVLVGLYGVDSEFYITESSGLFLHSTYGIGTDIAQSGINGPSIFPFTSPAVRIKLESAEKNIYLQSAIINGVAGSPNHLQGTQFRLNPGDDGALIVVEAGFTPGNENSPSKIAAGTWFYTKDMPDLVDLDTLGNPVGRTSGGAYVLGEHAIYREKGSETKGIDVFGRFGWANGNVNQFSYAWSMGAVYTGLFPSRTEGKLGLGIAGAHNSGSFKNASITAGTPVDNAETAIELTYSDNLTPWMTIQPDVQYIINPGTTPALDNALVLGSRLTVQF